MASSGLTSDKTERGAEKIQGADEQVEEGD